MIVLDHLRPLAASIRRNGATYGVFDFTYNGVTIDIFFDLGKTPFAMGLLPRGTNFNIWFEVKQGFRIRNSLSPAEYYGLVEVLGIQRDPINKFSVNKFLSFVNEQIPAECPRLNNSERQLIAQRVTTLEEGDKLIYDHLIDWSNGSTGNKRSSKNSEKTRLLRPDIYENIKDHDHISVAFRS